MLVRFFLLCHVEKALSNELIEAVRVVASARLSPAVTPTLTRQQSAGTGSSLFLGTEGQSPMLFSPIASNPADYKRYRASAPFGRAVRAPFFRKQPMKGKSLGIRGSLGSDASGWGGGNGKGERTGTEEEVGDLL